MSFLRLFLLILPILIHIPLEAQEDPPLPEGLQQELQIAENEGQDHAFSDRFIQMLFYLGALVAVMYGGSWIIKRMIKDKSIPQVKPEGLIKIIETQRLSLKTTLYIIDYKGEKCAIAESSTGQISITKL